MNKNQFKNQAEILYKSLLPIASRAKKIAKMQKALEEAHEKAKIKKGYMIFRISDNNRLDGIVYTNEFEAVKIIEDIKKKYNESYYLLDVTIL